MFDFLKSKKAKKSEELFKVQFHLRRGTNTEMPSNWLGAFVTFFASGKDYEAALKRVFNHLAESGYEIIEIKGQIEQLDPNQWDSFIQAAWSDFPDYYPRQNEILEALAGKGVLLFSPFAGYDQKPQ